MASSHNSSAPAQPLLPEVAAALSKLPPTPELALTGPPVAYVSVTDPPPTQEGARGAPGGVQQQPRRGLGRARYTKAVLKGTLQLMGCKPRTAHKVTEALWRDLQQRAQLPASHPNSLPIASPGRAAARMRQAGDITPAAPAGAQACAAADIGAPAGGTGATAHAEAGAASAMGAPGNSARHAPGRGANGGGEAGAPSDAGAVQQAAAGAVASGPEHFVEGGPGATADSGGLADERTAAADGTRMANGSAAHAVAVAISRAAFEAAVCARLVEWLPDMPPQALREDLQIACSLREQRTCVAVLLAGTSGTGKSTLAGLLAGRLGITTVLSTDSVRHMLRGFSSEAENPLLWASTYQAGDHIPEEAPRAGGGGEGKARAVRGYQAQSEMVIDSLDRLLTSCEARGESIVCEGVHLSLNFVVRLMQRHPSIVPFLIHISNEAKHRERFAVRAKYMTLDPGANRYVKYLRNIRAIQDYLVRRADKAGIPKVDNTNVDRSVATIHATVLGCLRRRARGESLLDPGGKTVKPLAAEFAAATSLMWSSKDSLAAIRRKAAAAAGGGAAAVAPPVPPSPDAPCSSTHTPSAPRSEAGEVVEDTRSFFDAAESDMVSSDPGGPERGGGREEGDTASSSGSEDGAAEGGAASDGNGADGVAGGGAPLARAGSVAESEAEDAEELEEAEHEAG